MSLLRGLKRLDASEEFAHHERRLGGELQDDRQDNGGDLFEFLCDTSRGVR
jgi:hypothetical protein